MKVAIIGCGNIAQVHLQVLSAMNSVTLAAVADIIPARADAAAAAYGAVPYYDYETLLDAAQPDAVHLCTPHYLHTPMALAALRRGVHVLTEKPCAVTAEEAAALAAAQRESGKQVGVCFQNRYNPCVIALKRMLDAGKLGDMQALRGFVTWNRGTDYYSDGWHGTLEKECGGVLINQAIHTLDLMQYLGGGCRAVTAHIANDHLQGAIEVEDTVCVRMTLQNDAPALLYATTGYGEDARVLIEVRGTKGACRLEGDRLFRLKADGTPVPVRTEPSAITYGKLYWGSSHTALIRDFYEHIESGDPFPLDAEEGGKASRIVAACYRSAGERNQIDGKEVML